MQMYTPEQRFPIGGSWTPGGPKQDFRGCETLFLRMRVCMFLYVLQKKNDIFEGLLVALLRRTLSSLLIPDNVTNLTI